MTNKKASFNDFCQFTLDRMYDPRFPLESQCSGYRLLRKMVIEKITPATLEEYNRWLTNPTEEELMSAPDLKYLTFLHELIRLVVRENWETIKNLEIE